MSDLLADLYQELVVDHSRQPRNRGPLPGATHDAKGHNPLCGDEITLRLKLDGDRVVDAKFEGHGCAISTASASLMTEAIRGKSKAELEALFGAMHRLLTGGEPGMALGKLEAFSGVRDFPARVKCAALSWHTLKNALEARGETAKTE
jgi:nitrogen fixation NifU-like protein